LILLAAKFRTILFFSLIVDTYSYKVKLYLTR
jgi:hypothetical protein